MGGVSILAGLVTFFWTTLLDRVWSSVLVFDAAGLAPFAVVGTRKAPAYGLDPIVAALLTKLASLPISTWSYKAQPDSVRHMGPTAQDFRAAFGLGEDDKHISTVDAEGVALAAIQALYKRSQESEIRSRKKDKEIRALYQLSK